MSFSVTAGTFERIEGNIDGSFLERETWRSLLEQKDRNMRIMTIHRAGRLRSLQTGPGTLSGQPTCPAASPRVGCV